MNLPALDFLTTKDEETMAQDDELGARWIGWGLVGALWLLVVTISGFVMSNQAASITELEKRLSNMGERVSTLEAHAVRLQVIENKLDGLRDALVDLKTRR